LYFYRNRNRFSDWQAVIIYPSRAAEQSQVYPHRSLLNGEQVHRVYLNELGAIRELPIAVAALVLTIVEEGEAPEAARELLTRTEQEALTPIQRRDIIDTVTSIMVYKFANLSRSEIQAMLGLNLSEEPRAIREAKEAGREEGREAGREEGREAGREEEAIAFVTRLLNRRLGQPLSEEMRSRLATLSLPMLENLGEALLDFENLADLQAWLAQRSISDRD
jgi:predicted transposase/invertase (TIGR01784 family)